MQIDPALIKIERRLEAIEKLMRDLAEHGNGAPSSDVLTLKEAAQYLNMRPARLSEACRRNRIAYVRSNRHYRFRRADLDEFLATFRHARRSVFH